MPQFQILGNGSPKWNAMLVDGFCNVQLRLVKLNFKQDSTICPECSARVAFIPVFNPKAITNNLQMWLSSFTSYHILNFGGRDGKLNILKCNTKKFS